MFRFFLVLQCFLDYMGYKLGKWYDCQTNLQVSTVQVMDGLADEVVHKYRCEIIFDDWQDLTEALIMINKFSPGGIVASAEHGGPIMPHFRNGKWHVTIAV